jgi:hypothetical protein
MIWLSKPFSFYHGKKKQGIVEMENDLLFPGNEKGGSPHSYTRILIGKWRSMYANQYARMHSCSRIVRLQKRTPPQKHSLSLAPDDILFCDN